MTTTGGASRRRLTPPQDPYPPSRVPVPEAGARALTGRTAVVTGAARGIGAGIAATFAWHGARVLLVDNDRVALTATANRLAGFGANDPVVLELDVTDPATPRTVLDRADGLGGVDVLVNNVGDYRPSGPFLATTERDWQVNYDMNLGHVLRMTHALLPGMVERRRGSIVSLSSVEGLRGIPGNAVYGALKAAVINFTAALAAEVGQYGIRVNCLAPDLTDTPQTPMWDATDEKYADHVGKWVPVGRYGHPIDLGDAALFLASDQSAFVTGSTLRVDGGTLAAPGWFRRDETHFTNMPRPLK